ncbi:MAG: beta-lactamase family protein [Acidipropionibacterium jensenii]|nr:beta-lactamase family protein [Acidipropionibacterium jensenii]
MRPAGRLDPAGALRCPVGEPWQPPSGFAEICQQVLAAQLDAATLALAPSCVAAITWRGRVVAVHTSGQPRMDGAPAGPGTVYRIASMSKSFLAAAALSLREDDVLNLDRPARELIGGLESARFGAGGAGSVPLDATLDELLSNRSGIAEDNPWGDEHLAEPRQWMADRVAEGLRLSAFPGTVYQYSNLGVSQTGRAIEAVTGIPVEQAVRERILDPLGLSATRADPSMYPDGTDLARGFRTFDDGSHFRPEPLVGSGALGCIGELFSTVGDVASWMHFLGSAFDEIPDPGLETVLSASSRRRMQTGHTLMRTTEWPFAGRRLDGAGYGYGLICELDHRFGRVAQHSGGLPGFSSHMRWHPTTGIGVVVMANSNSFGAWRPASAILSTVLDAVEAPSARVRVWPEALEAAFRMERTLVSGGSLEDLLEPVPDTGLLSRNVLRDVPWAVRSQRLAALTDQAGPVQENLPPLAERILTAPTPAALRWAVPCQRATLVCDLRMVGLHHPVVQAIDTQLAGPDGRKPAGEQSLAQDHIQVLI